MNEPEAEVWMGQMAELTRGEGALPDPALIWWRAQMLEKQAVQARIRRPMEIAQWVSLVAAVATMLVLGALNWSGMKGMLEPAGAAPLLAAGGAVILAAVALRFVLAE